MIWGPFVLAVVFGLLTSAVVHFVWIWPREEPLDDEADSADGADGADGEGPAATSPGSGPAAG